MGEGGGPARYEGTGAGKGTIMKEAAAAKDAAGTGALCRVCGCPRRGCWWSLPPPLLLASLAPYPVYPPLVYLEA